MYISVYYQDKRDMGTVTNIDGEYKLDARRNGGTLVFSSIGYVTKTVKVGSGNQTVNVKLSGRCNAHRSSRKTTERKIPARIIRQSNS